MENVENGHERIVLQNSEGILVTYERNRALGRRLDEVYRNAGLLPATHSVVKVPVNPAGQFVGFSPPQVGVSDYR
jgi:hypothetical protein